MKLTVWVFKLTFQLRNVLHFLSFTYWQRLNYCSVILTKAFNAGYRNNQYR